MKDEWLTFSSFIVNFASSFFSFSFSIWSLTFHMQSRLIKTIIAAERMRNLRTNCQEKHFMVRRHQLRRFNASLLQTIRIYHLFHWKKKHRHKRCGQFSSLYDLSGIFICIGHFRFFGILILMMCDKKS